MLRDPKTIRKSKVKNKEKTQGYEKRYENCCKMSRLMWSVTRRLTTPYNYREGVTKFQLSHKALEVFGKLCNFVGCCPSEFLAFFFICFFFELPFVLPDSTANSRAQCTFFFGGILPFSVPPAARNSLRVEILLEMRLLCYDLFKKKTKLESYEWVRSTVIYPLICPQF